VRKGQKTSSSGEIYSFSRYPCHVRTRRSRPCAVFTSARRRQIPPLRLASVGTYSNRVGASNVTCNAPKHIIDLRHVPWLERFASGHVCELRETLPTRQLGRFVAFRFAMLATGTHAAAWSLQGATTAVRAIALTRLATSYVRQVVCGLRGHEMVLHFEPDRLSLQCLACGARTQGWTIDVNPAYRLPRRQVSGLSVHHLHRGSSPNMSGRQHEPESSGEQLTAA
jgi:hypothetical protein